MRRSVAIRAAAMAAALVTGVIAAAAPAAAADPPKRPKPDYSNRGPKPTTAGDVALTIARVIASPMYLVTEFVIRRPLEAVIPPLERSNIPKELYDFFLFGPDHKAGIVPTFLADFGLRPSVGLYGFWTDAGVKRHDLVVHGSTWGPDWLAGSITDRIRYDDHSSDNQSLTLEAVARPDRPFYGIGPRSLQANESRFGAAKIDAYQSFDRHIASFATLHAQVGLRRVDFYDGHNLDGDPTLGQSIAAGILPPPPGYLHDYTIMASSLRLALDSRGEKAKSGSGVRLELGGQQATDLNTQDHSEWIKYGGLLMGSLDLNGHHRVLSLSVATQFVDPMTKDAVIPFTELVSLGGTEPMRAYLVGRMLGRSAFVSTLEYRWPVWAVLDGTIKAEFGNVFDAHLEDFAPNLLRFSGSIGIQTSGVSDNPLQVLFGVGSETFEQGGKIDSFRFYVGTTTNAL